MTAGIDRGALHNLQYVKALRTQTTSLKPATIKKGVGFTYLTSYAMHFPGGTAGRSKVGEGTTHLIKNTVAMLTFGNAWSGFCPFFQ